MYRTLILLSTIVLSRTAFAATVDTFKVSFDLNKSILSTKSKLLLDSLLYVDGFTDRKITILGYTDYLGSDSANIRLSYARANVVQSYLVESGLNKNNVTVCIGKGEVERTPISGRKGFVEDRVVKVISQEYHRAVPLRKKTDSTGIFHNKPVKEFQWDSDPSGLSQMMVSEHDKEFPDHVSHENGSPTITKSNFVAVDHGGENIIMRKDWLIRFFQTNTNKKDIFLYSNYSIELAMLYGLLNNADSVFYYLNGALNSCPDSNRSLCDEIWTPNILGFCHFDSYLKTEAWKRFETRIISAYKRRHSNVNVILAIQIFKASGRDQSVRMIYRLSKSTANLRRVKKTDSLNLLFVKDFISKNGFPKISEIGKDVADELFLLVQHADNDIRFQEIVLEQLKKLIPLREVNLENVALLTDRILVSKDGKQLYGTQVKNSSSRELYPIIDPLNFNSRREEMHLPPLDR